MLAAVYTHNSKSYNSSFKKALLGLTSLYCLSQSCASFSSWFSARFQCQQCLRLQDGIFGKAKALTFVSMLQCTLVQIAVALSWHEGLETSMFGAEPRVCSPEYHESTKMDVHRYVITFSCTFTLLGPHLSLDSYTLVCSSFSTENTDCFYFLELSKRSCDPSLFAFPPKAPGRLCQPC